MILGTVKGIYILEFQNKCNKVTTLTWKCKCYLSAIGLFLYFLYFSSKGKGTDLKYLIIVLVSISVNSYSETLLFTGLAVKLLAHLDNSWTKLFFSADDRFAFSQIRTKQSSICFELYPRMLVSVLRILMRFSVRIHVFALCVSGMLSMIFIASAVGH